MLYLYRRLKNLGPADPGFLNVTQEQIAVEMALEWEVAKPKEERDKEDRDQWFEDEAAMDDAEDGESAPEAEPQYSEEDRLQALEEVTKLMKAQGVELEEVDAWGDEDAES